MHENEDSDHLRLRGLLQQAKLLLLPMSEQQKKWVAESPLAQEISAILAKHPEFMPSSALSSTGIFPEPKCKST
jgi:hypothetical protein